MGAFLSRFFKANSSNVIIPPSIEQSETAEPLSPPTVTAAPAVAVATAATATEKEPEKEKEKEEEKEEEKESEKESEEEVTSMTETGVDPAILNSAITDIKSTMIPGINPEDIVIIADNMTEHSDIINIILGSIAVGTVIASSILMPVLPVLIISGFAVSLISNIIIEYEKTRQKEINEIYDLMLHMLMMLLKINYFIVEFNIINASDTNNVTILIKVIMEKCIMLIINIDKLSKEGSVSRIFKSSVGNPVKITSTIYNQITIINSMYIQILTELEFYLMNQYFEQQDSTEFISKLKKAIKNVTSNKYNINTIKALIDRNATKKKIQPFFNDQLVSQLKSTHVDEPIERTGSTKPLSEIYKNAVTTVLTRKNNERLTAELDIIDAAVETYEEEYNTEAKIKGIPMLTPLEKEKYRKELLKRYSNPSIPKRLSNMLQGTSKGGRKRTKKYRRKTRR